MVYLLKIPELLLGMIAPHLFVQIRSSRDYLGKVYRLFSLQKQIYFQLMLLSPLDT